MINLELNKKSFKLCNKLIKESRKLNIGILPLRNNAKIIDCGINHIGGFEAAKIVTEIALGGLAEAEIHTKMYDSVKLKEITVKIKYPAIATLCSQAAFPIYPDQKTQFYICGPGRALFRLPREIFDFLNYYEDSDVAVFIIQDNEFPSLQFVERIVRDIKVNPENLCFIITPVPSICGNTQVCAKAVESVIFTLYQAFKWDIRKISYAEGVTPIVPSYQSERGSQGGATPDDFIFYGSSVKLLVDDISEIEDITPSLTFKSTKVYGKTFLEILKEANGDVRNIDGYPHVFLPAEIIITDKNENTIKYGSVEVKRIASMAKTLII